MTDDTDIPIPPVARQVSAASSDNELTAYLGGKATDVLAALNDKTTREAVALRDFRDPATGQVIADWQQIDRWLAATRDSLCNATPEAQLRTFLALRDRVGAYRAALVQQAADRAAAQQAAYVEQRKRDAPHLVIAEFAQAGFTLALTPDGDGLLMTQTRPTAMLPPGHDIKLSEHRDAIIAILRAQAEAAERATAWSRPTVVA